MNINVLIMLHHNAPEESSASLAVHYTNHLKSIVSPASKLHLAVLIIKWKPGDVNSAGWLEYSRRNLLALSSASHHNVGRKSGIKVLIGAVVKKNIWLPHFDRRNSNILIKRVHTIRFENAKSIISCLLHGYLRTPWCSTRGHHLASRGTARCCSSGSDSSRPGQQFVAGLMHHINGIEFLLNGHT